MRRIVVGVGGIVLAVLLVGGLTTGIGSAQSATPETNASMGADVSSFMQASGAEAESELDDGMFDAALNRTTDPDERRALLKEREQRLEERHQALRTQRGKIDRESSIRAHAIATRVAVGVGSLERSVNATEKAATEAGVDTERLGTIRSNTSELRGPDVAELARGVSGPPGESPENPTRGSPDDAAEENRTEVSQSTNESATPPESAANRPTESDVQGTEPSESPSEQAAENREGSSREIERGKPRQNAPENGTNRADIADEPGPSEPADGDENHPGGDNERKVESSDIGRSNGDRGVSGDLIP